MKKVYMFLIMLLGIGLFTGCTEKLSADETANLLYNFYIKEDISEISKLGIEEVKATEIITNSITNFREELSNALKGVALEEEVEVQIDNNKVEEIIDLRRGLEKQLKADIEIVTTEKDTITLQINTSYFDEVAIYNRAQEGLNEKMEKVEITDKDEFIQKCIDTYTEEIIKAYKEAEISTDTTAMTFLFKKIDGVWKPENEQQFIDDLTELTSGYKNIDVSYQE